MRLKANADLQYKLDSIDAATAYEASLLKLQLTKAKQDSFVINQMAPFKYDWNKPYDIKKDREITLQKYLDYCKANGYDPETYYKTIE